MYITLMLVHDYCSTYIPLLHFKVTGGLQSTHFSPILDHSDSEQHILFFSYNFKRGHVAFYVITLIQCCCHYRSLNPGQHYMSFLNSHELPRLLSHSQFQTRSQRPGSHGRQYFKLNHRMENYPCYRYADSTSDRQSQQQLQNKKKIWGCANLNDQ